MLILSKYLYLLGAVTSFIIFLAIYIYRHDLRKKMLFMGVIFSIFGFLLELFFFLDYWKPPLIFKLSPFGGIEDLLFGLAVGGVGCALYDVCFPKSQSKRTGGHGWVLPFVFVTELISILVLTTLLGINSIYSSAVGFGTCGLIIVILRRDLIKRAIFTSIFGGLLLVAGESLFLMIYPSYLSAYFLLNNKIGLLFGLVPVTELIWGVAFGFMIGTIYNFHDGS